MSTVPEVRTERLLMRGWREDDFEPFSGIMADPEISFALGRETGTTPLDAWRDMAMLAGHWELRGFGHWVLEERGSGEFVGRAGLYFPPDWPEIEVGWTVARAHWGEGYAPEAARAACEWAHRELGLEHVVSLIHPSNARSIRVAEKLGETVEGRIELRGFDLIVYGTDLPLGKCPA